MKDYAAILLVLLLPFALASCGGSSDGEDPGTGQKDIPPSATPEAKPQIYTFSDDSSLTPNVAFATDEEMVIVLGSDLDGKEMPFKSVFLQKDGIGSMLVEISANGLPSAIIAGDVIFKINKYSYAEGKWFMQFSVDQNGTISDLTVELPQSFGAHISNLDSWMRNRINTAYQASATQNQSQSNARNIKTEEFLEFVAVTVELGACGISAVTANPLVIAWACQSAVRSTIDFLDDAPLVSPTNLDTQKCFFGIGENGISFMDPACLVATGLRIAADRVKDGDSDISEMEELADKSMDENRFIGEDPVIEDFPTPLLTVPRVAIISPQWLETFSPEQDVRIQVAASESVEVIDYEIRSKESGAFLISGNTGKGPAGNFEIDIAAESLEPGTYFVTVSATRGEFVTQTYRSFVVDPTQTEKTLRIAAISTDIKIYDHTTSNISNHTYPIGDGNGGWTTGSQNFTSDWRPRVFASEYDDLAWIGDHAGYEKLPASISICRLDGKWISKSVSESGSSSTYRNVVGSMGANVIFRVNASGVVSLSYTNSVSGDSNRANDTISSISYEGSLGLTIDLDTKAFTYGGRLLRNITYTDRPNNTRSVVLEALSGTLTENEFNQAVYMRTIKLGRNDDIPEYCY
ncbi:hypothetical protein LL254_04190 [Marinobacter nauticus]|uniref:hypothetical protein n=1 Tax=Marinobacter nauticus TaxID=2743 RepID=UPI001D17EAAD|nr:hypothetical protein [Marinobacter nauticus]MCC4269896.1 hypothetical protein [Marinobacter nauticus]